MVAPLCAAKGFTLPDFAPRFLEFRSSISTAAGHSSPFARFSSNPPGLAPAQTRARGPSGLSPCSRSQAAGLARVPSALQPRGKRLVRSAQRVELAALVATLGAAARAAKSGDGCSAKRFTLPDFAPRSLESGSSASPLTGIHPRSHGSVPIHCARSLAVWPGRPTGQGAPAPLNWPPTAVRMDVRLTGC